MALGLSLAPGATFRHLMTFYKDNQDGPRQDLTLVVFEVVNLEPAPWVIEVQPIDLEAGQVCLYISDEFTKLAPANGQYPFQVRMTFEHGDKVFLQPIVINTGPAYRSYNDVINPLEPAVPNPAEPMLPLEPAYAIGYDRDNLTQASRIAAARIPSSQELAK